MVLLGGHRHTNNFHCGETCSSVNEQHVQPKKSEINRMSVYIAKRRDRISFHEKKWIIIKSSSYII